MKPSTLLRENWRAGITVGLVSIPLSVSLAVASLATPTMGIITAVWAGFVAALFGGSKFNIVGPTGALSGILATYAFTHGTSALPMLAIATGAFVLVAWAFKLERWLIYIPSSAIHGFTLGVALIISLNQLDFALGLTNLSKHERFISNVWESLSHIAQSSPTTFILFLATLALLFVFLKILPKFPGIIVLTPVGVMIGKLSTEGHIPFRFLTLQDKFADISGQLFQMHGWVIDRDLLMAAFAAALIAIIETMVSAKMADAMTKTKHDKRKEMLGLGLANVMSGLMGGLPATAALARTSLNVKNGATHQTSGLVSAITIVGISLLLLPWFKFVPMAMIAAILVFVAIRMVEHEHFLRMYRHDWRSFAICVITAVITVLQDPIVGVLFGTAAALLIFTEKVSQGPFELVVHASDGGKTKIVDKKDHASAMPEDTLIYSFTGQLAYLNAESHAEHFKTHATEAGRVILRLRHLYYMDLDGLDALEEIIHDLHAQGKTVLISGVNPLIRPMLERSQVIRELETRHRIFDRTSHAIEAAPTP